MAPQTETVTLPEPTRTDVGDWQFPDGWSNEDIRDWLATHPEGRPQVETVIIADPPTAEELRQADESAIRDDDVTEDLLNTPLDEIPEMGPEELKANGTYAAAIAVPMDLQDTVTSDNYDPRQFILVHTDVFDDLVGATHAEAELGLENKELRKRVNALTRGMRKVNKHWSATKRENKRLLQRAKERADWQEKIQQDTEALWEQDRKRATIFATRLARRLRKARAGRDKRERQLQQANLVIRDQGHVLDAQNHYIDHLEALINGARR